MRKLLACAIAVVLLLSPAGFGQTFHGVYERAAVAADHPLASKAGAEILEAGGNAVDAAVATSFALSVTRPFSCGIGGGGFMVIALPEHPKQKSRKDIRVVLNYREMAPGFATTDVFDKLEKSDPQASTIGGRAAAVPGTVAGLLKALDDFGSLPREKVMAPAIRIAREGFAVDAAYVHAARSVAASFERDAALKERFAFTFKRLLLEGKIEVGDLIKFPEQADALDLIAKDGAKAFYSGAIADAIVAACKADSERVPSKPPVGTMTAADLKTYKVQQAEPLKFEFAGRTFLAMPPPSSGGLAMAETLGIMQAKGVDGYLKGAGQAPSGAKEPTPLFVQLAVESFKHAFADRAEWLADPAFSNVPVARLLAPEYLKERAATIDMTRTFGADWYGTREGGAQGLKDDGGTSHFCVVDGKGGAVACTETINLEFGSLLAVEKFGFVLNNQMDDFTAHAGKPNAFGLVQSAKNAPQKGKRPLSSMSPTIVLNKAGKVEAVAGASGGPRIISATTQVLLNAILLGCDAPEAVERPRFHHQWTPNVLEFERNYPGTHEGLAVPMWLRKLRHEVKETDKHACVQLILRGADGKLHAASDPRKGGQPAGK